MPIPIKDLLPSFFKETNDWHTSVLAHWDSLMGNLKTRVRLEKIQGDIVIVGVYEVHWMQELYLLSDVLKDSINQFLGHPHVKQVRFKLVEEKKRTVVKGLRKRALVATGEVSLSPAQERALACINDVQLRQALKAFWGKCLEK